MHNKFHIVLASLFVIAISIFICLFACTVTLAIYVYLFGIASRYALSTAMGWSVFLFIGLVGTWFEHILPELINQE